MGRFGFDEAAGLAARLHIARCVPAVGSAAPKGGLCHLIEKLSPASVVILLGRAADLGMLTTESTPLKGMGVQEMRGHTGAGGSLSSVSSKASAVKSISMLPEGEVRS